MSDTMLFGVIRMPYDMAMADELSRRQFYDRAQQAANELAALRQQLEEANARIDTLEQEINCAETALEAGLVNFPDVPTDFECIGKMADELVKQYRATAECRLAEAQGQGQEAAPQPLSGEGDKDKGMQPNYSCFDAEQYERDRDERVRELERLVGIGAKWMREWVAEGMCECEYGHACGKTERQRELAQMDAALAASKGEQSWTPEISRRAAFGCIELLCLKLGVDMTAAEAKNLRAMKGKFVKVEWRKPEDDWPYFRLLEVNERTSTIKLRGMDFPNGTAKHDGDEFWVDWLDVKHIEPVMVRI